MSFKPEFKGPIEGWTVNYVKRNIWKVERSMEWQDLMQEAYIVFLRVAAKYPEVETPQHFMALYKLAFTRAFIDFAYLDTKLRNEVSASGIVSQDDTQGGYEVMGDLNNDGNLATLLRQAPREVLMVLNLFLNAPTELVELALSSWQGQDKRCKTGGSAKICRMLGLPPELDVMEMVRSHFQPH